MLKNIINNLRQNKWKLLILLLLALIAFVCALLLNIITTLPDIEKISSLNPAESTILYSIKGQEIARLHGEENRQIVPLSKISPRLIECVLVTEDENFFRHHGIDFLGIIRAILKNINQGRLSQGASTITQQLARSLFLNHKRTLTRKIAEALLAMEIERNYTKEEILELYLNNVYWGHNAYGVESAAWLYFDKPAKELDLAEAALLTGLLSGPEIYSPYKNFERAKKKQAYVLSRLVANNRITEKTADKLFNQKLVFPETRLARFGYIAPYFVSYIKKYLLRKYGKTQVYQGGLKVYTTLDLTMQKAAENIITEFTSREGERYKFTQAALVAIDPRTGYIKAMVGGVNFNKSKFNRAVQAKRQPGSAFKPFIYTAAMEQGLSPGTIVLDTIATWEVPVSKWNPQGKWSPQNFDRKFRGPVTIRHALEASLNMPAVKVLDKIGRARAVDVARRMGISSDLEPNLALALGASDVTLMEMTSAFGVFANAGIRIPPAGIIKIVDRHGRILEQHQIEGKRVIKSNIAAVMIDMMKGVLIRGTGHKGRLNREAAAKTGTTSDYKDAWFIGFVPQLVAGVWVGNDDNKPMRGVAEVGVCPRIWKAFMKVSLKNITPRKFPRPKGLVTVKICLDSGQIATPNCPQDRIISARYWKSSVPYNQCPVHTENPDQEKLNELNEFINDKPPEGYLIR